MKTLILIDREDFQKTIYNIIVNEEYQYILENMVDPSAEFERGFIQGLLWASLYTIKCKVYEGVIDEDETSK